MTVIGISKDGYVIYTPYLSSGTQVKSGFDICNGMFYDSIGNYAYFATTTTTYPYITGCFGLANHPLILNLILPLILLQVIHTCFITNYSHIQRLQCLFLP